MPCSSFARKRNFYFIVRTVKNFSLSEKRIGNDLVGTETFTISEIYRLELTVVLLLNGSLLQIVSVLVERLVMNALLVFLKGLKRKEDWNLYGGFTLANRRNAFLTDWWKLASQYEEQGKSLIFCRSCEQVFYLSEETRKNLNGGRFTMLEALSRKANCCPDPLWFFIVAPFVPQRSPLLNEKPVCFLKKLKLEDQIKIILENRI